MKLLELYQEPTRVFCSDFCFILFTPTAGKHEKSIITIPTRSLVLISNHSSKHSKFSISCGPIFRFYVIGFKFRHLLHSTTQLNISNSNTASKVLQEYNSHSKTSLLSIRKNRQFDFSSISDCRCNMFISRATYTIYIPFCLVHILIE